jgi:hypothetical protein
MEIAKKHNRLVECRTVRRAVHCHSPSSGSEDRHRMSSLAVCHPRLHPIALADRGRSLDHPNAAMLACLSDSQATTD